jgi:hypothetical protein
VAPHLAEVLPVEQELLDVLPLEEVVEYLEEVPPPPENSPSKKDDLIDSEKDAKILLPKKKHPYGIGVDPPRPPE